MTGEFTSDRGLPLSDPVVVRGWTGCRHALSGAQLASDPVSGGYEVKPTYNMLLLDGELHQAARRLTWTWFTRARLDAVAGRLDELGDELARTLAGRSDVDLLADLAEPLVLEGILALMEVADDRREPLGGMARQMIGLLESEASAEARRGAAGAALRATILFERDGKAGRATGFHASLEAAAAAGRIPVRLARSTPVVMLHGGYENPLNQLGCVLAWAVSHVDEFAAAAATDPDALFEEVLRVYSPVRYLARWVSGDGELPLSRGTFVLVDLGSANTDPDRWPAGSDVDLAERRGHLGFGYGRHRCVGTALARIEGRVLIRALAALPPELLASCTVEWRNSTLTHGPSRVAAGALTTEGR
jgi:cytochrome P450